MISPSPDLSQRHSPLQPPAPLASILVFFFIFRSQTEPPSLLSLSILKSLPSSAPASDPEACSAAFSEVVFCLCLRVAYRTVIYLPLPLPLRSLLNGLILFSSTGYI